MKLSRLVSFALVCLVLGETFGMPTGEEISAAIPIVKELTSSDFADMRSGKKTHVQLADALVSYVSEAETEAGKFVLLREAFKQCVAGGDVKKAIETYDLMRNEIKDLPNGLFASLALPSVPAMVKRGTSGSLSDLIEGAVASGDLESAENLVKKVKPSLIRLKKTDDGEKLQRSVSKVVELGKVQKDVRVLRAECARSPDDAVLREKLGKALVVLNDWKGGLKEFAQTSGRMSEVAVWENCYSAESDKGGLTAAEVAEFWWTYADGLKGENEVALSVRRHAANWYQVAIADGTLTGLKRSLAEKRVAELETQGSGLGPAAGVPALSSPGKPMKVLIAKGVELELLPCPAGKFEMGYPESNWTSHKPHEVTISQPFWMAKTPTTVEQWEGVAGKYDLHDTDKVFGHKKIAVGRITWQEACDFCGQMTKKYRKILPRGYVFRLPTEAEWEYACKANAKDPNDLHAAYRFRALQEEQRISVKNQDKVEYFKRHGFPDADRMQYDLLWPVGTKQPNGWGFYDMIGINNEYVLDTYPRIDNGRERRMAQDAALMQYEGLRSTDPVSVCDMDCVALMRSSISRGATESGGKKKWCSMNVRVGCVGFRVVVAPDVLRVQKSKRK